MKKYKYNKIDKILELPKEICSNIPKLTITGFDEIIIENMTEDDIKVTGKIESVDVERTIDE